MEREYIVTEEELKRHFVMKEVIEGKMRLSFRIKLQADIKA
ncbi:MAG: hypothetical protein ACP5JA_03875 [Thermodesulfovibrio sp.]